MFLRAILVARITQWKQYFKRINTTAETHTVEPVLTCQRLALSKKSSNTENFALVFVYVIRETSMLTLVRTGALLSPEPWYHTSRSDAWNPKNEVKLRWRVSGKHALGYGTCGLSVNMPSACPHSSVMMYAHAFTHWHSQKHTYANPHSDFIWLGCKQRRSSSSRKTTFSVL